MGDILTKSAPTALITGASSGIGYELAKLFAKDHHNLVLVARNGPRLEQVGNELQRQFGIMVRTVALDLAAPTAAQSLFEELRREGIAVHILVNNAGYGKFGEFAEVALEESAGQIQLNITALTSSHQALCGADAAAGFGQDHERGIDRGVSAWSADGGVLRHQGVRDFLFGGAGQRIGVQGHYGDLPLSGSDRDGVRRPRRQRPVTPVQEASPHGGEDRGSRRLPGVCSKARPW